MGFDGIQLPLAGPLSAGLVEPALLRAQSRPPQLSRTPPAKRLVRIGACPRATINLTLAARACALLEGRDHVTPDDLKLIAPDVLRHRVLLTYEAEAEEVTTESIVQTLLGKVKVP